MNEYYDVHLKEYRLRQIEEAGGDWQFVRGNIANKQLVDDVFAAYRPDVVVNLAAQAGVRYSITNPDAYMEANIIGFYNILEACRHSYDDGLPLPPYAVYNIGNNHPENLLEFVEILQEELIGAGVLPENYDFATHKRLVPMQPGDVPVTYADTSGLERDFGFKPSTSLRDGLRSFAMWYKEFYQC